MEIKTNTSWGGFDSRLLRELGSPSSAPIAQKTPLNVGRTHFAILFGDDGGNLRGVNRDLEKIRNELGARNFEVAELFNQSRQKVLAAINAIANKTTESSRVIIYYSGHGSEKGLALRKSFGPLKINATLSPTELYSHLLPFKGKKAVILDCCHAGIFLAGVPPDTLVIAGAQKDEYAYGHEGIFTKALIRFFGKHSSDFNLAELKADLADPLNCKTMLGVGQHPKMAGQGGFTMLGR